MCRIYYPYLLGILTLKRHFCGHGHGLAALAPTASTIKSVQESKQGSWLDNSDYTLDHPKKLSENFQSQVNCTHPNRLYLSCIDSQRRKILAQKRLSEDYIIQMWILQVIKNMEK